MSTNFMLSNSGINQSLYNAQTSVTPQRTRAVSVCNNTGIAVGSHFHSNLSQSFPPISMIENSWTQNQQGLYVNGLGKVVNIFPGAAQTETDDALNQPNETYNYPHSVKLTGIGPQASGLLYQQQSSTFAASNQGSIPTQMHIALAAAPNGMTPHTNVPPSSTSLQPEPMGAIHSSCFHQGSAQGQSFFVPGVVGQQAVHQHQQNAVSPSLYPEAVRISGSVHSLGANNLKFPVPPVNGPNNARVIQGPLGNSSGTQANYPSSIPIAHPMASHHLYSNPTVPHIPPMHLSSVPPGVVEFLPAMFSADSGVQSSMNHTSSSVYGQLSTPLGSYESNTQTLEGPLSSRVRHNTWSGLVSNMAHRASDQSSTKDKAHTTGNNSLDVGHTPHQPGVTADIPQASMQTGPHGYLLNHNSSLHTAASHRPGLIDIPPSVAFSANSFQHQHQSTQDMITYNSVDSNFSKPPKTEVIGSKGAPWSTTVAPHSSYWSFQPQANNRLFESGYMCHALQQRAAQFCSTAKGSLARSEGGATRSQVDLSRLDYHNARPAHPYGRAPGPVNCSKPLFVRPPSMLDVTQQPHGRTTGFPVSNSAMDYRWDAFPSNPRNENMFRVGNQRTDWNQQPFSLDFPDTAYRPKLSPSGTFLRPTDVASHFTTPIADTQLLPRIGSLRSVLDSCPMRVLISTALVGAVIGRGGRTIRMITSKTGAQIDFKPETVWFSQFSLPNGLRNNLTTSSKSGNHEVSEQVSDSVNAESIDPLVFPLSNPHIGSTDSRYNRCQIVVLLGSRKQCSSALTELLAVCFRESEHKGLSAPCLGMLLPHHIYTQLLMHEGRRYFNIINAITGARVTVTSSPAHIQSKFTDSATAPNFSAGQTVEPTDERILVIRGQFNSICSAESYLSERIRFVIGEFLISPTLWPLLSYLPLPTLDASIDHSKFGVKASHDFQLISRLVMPIADIFWPHSVYSTLSKHASFSASYPEMVRLLFQPNLNEDRKMVRVQAAQVEPDSSVTDANSDSSENNIPTTNGTSRSTESVPVTEEPSSEVEHSVDNSITAESSQNRSVTEDDQRSSPCFPLNAEPLASSASRVVKDNDFTPPPLSGSVATLANAIQQALIAVVGPATWLATSGMLHMRVSYNEAGVVIGAGGCRILQLMQSTGAEIRIGKTPISGPYALSQSLRQSSTVSTTEGQTEANLPTKTNSLDENFTQQEEKSSVFPVSDMKQGCSFECVTKAVTENVHDSNQDDTVCFHGVQTLNDKATGVDISSDSSTDPVDGEHSTDDWKDETHSNVTGTSCPASTQAADPLSDKATTVTSYRLATLSGPFQAQLQAHWRIFQRLQSLHRRERLRDVSTTSDHSETDGKSRAAEATVFKSATLVCLPYKFLCWLTSNNVRFAEFMSSPSPGATKSSLPNEGCSPLHWLQSEAARRLGCSSPKVISLLPEPRRRRRLVQQQLRRAGMNRRSPQFGDNLKTVFLPSVGLSHDGLDSLWSDPNRVPLEIYADYETTQVVLGHLHHMLSLWLYGQALANPSGIELFSASPLLVHSLANQRPGHSDQLSKFLACRPNETIFPRSVPSDWSHQWHPSSNSAFNRVPPYRNNPYSTTVPIPDACGRLSNVRAARFTNRNHYLQSNGSRIPQNHGPPDSILSYPPNQLRPLTPLPFSNSPFTPGLMSQGALMSGPPTFGTGFYQRLNHNFISPNAPGPRLSGPWSPFPFVWDYSSFLNRATQPPRRQSLSTHRPNRKNAAVTKVSTTDPQDGKLHRSPSVKSEKTAVAEDTGD